MFFPVKEKYIFVEPQNNLGIQKKRPVVVVSLDVRNQYSSTVLVVPFSSFIEGIENNPCRVLVKKR